MFKLLYTSSEDYNDFGVSKVISSLDKTLRKKISDQNILIIYLNF